MKNKEIVIAFGEAMLAGDQESALSLLSDDVVMSWPGFFALPGGKESVRDFLKNVPPLTRVGENTYLCEGDKVVGTGVVAAVHPDGKTRKSYFSDHFTLKADKICEIQSYMVPEKADLDAAG